MSDVGTFLKLLELNRRLDQTQAERKREQDAALAIIDVAIEALGAISEGIMTEDEMTAESNIALEKMELLVKAYAS